MTNDERLASLLDGTLPEDEAREFLRELESSRDILDDASRVYAVHAILGAMREVGPLSARVTRSVRALGLSAHDSERIKGAVMRGVRRSHGSRVRRLPRRAAVVGLAAAAVVFLAMALWRGGGDAPRGAFTVASCRGRVSVRAAGERRPLATGDGVAWGAVLATGHDGLVELRSRDGVEIALRGGSELDLPRPGGGEDGGRIELEHGSVALRIRPGSQPGGFAVHGGGFAATALGTRFTVSVEEEKTSLAVTSGEVAFGLPGGTPVIVEQGFCAEGEGGRVATPVRIAERLIVMRVLEPGEAVASAQSEGTGSVETERAERTDEALRLSFALPDASTVSIWARIQTSPEDTARSSVRVDGGRPCRWRAQDDALDWRWAELVDTWGNPARYGLLAGSHELSIEGGRGGGLATVLVVRDLPIDPNEMPSLGGTL